MNLTRRKLKRILRYHVTIIVSGSAIVSSLLILVLVLVPTVSKIQTLIRENETIFEDITLLESKIDLLDSYDATILANNLTSLVDALPQEKSLGYFISTIGAIEQEQIIDISSYAFEAPGSISTGSAEPASKKAADNPYESLSMTLSAIGSLDEIQNLFQTVGTLKPILSVPGFSLSFRLNEDGSADNIARLSLTADFNYRKPKIPRPAPLDPLPRMTDDDSELLTDIGDRILLAKNERSEPLYFQPGRNPFSN